MTTDSAAISSLLARVRAATDEDRELDGDLFWKFNERSSEAVYWQAALGLPRKLDHSRPIPGGLGKHAVITGSPRVTSSIDAAVALVERVRPGFSVLLAWNPERAICNVHPKPLGDMQQWAPVGEAKTPALALLAALLSSMEANDGK